MVCDDELHLRNSFTVISKKAVELMHGSLILVTKPVDLAIPIALRRVMRLGRLVQHKESWNGPTPAAEKAVQTEMRGNVIADPIFSAAHLGKRKRPVVGVCNDRQMLEIQPQRVLAMFEIQR
ncbi:hypothetical protein ROJ8625_03610 [Roseivivax jejudonensis]|uniref:Uncharacterized protein n=1 Tax=Roseivivax jejudonensis TaxID=1529041 RepID=A0A1X7A3N7_9RHOB|nr:hypothetical protein ROJ8625_03610 [Roseivivax jejudonensis]